MTTPNRQPLDSAALPEALLTIKTVSSVTGISPSTIHRKLLLGEFPQPVRFGKRCTRWHASSLREWINAIKVA